LEQKGFVSVIPVDRRQRALELTKSGAELHDRILPIALQREATLLSPLSGSERKALLELLRKLRLSVAMINEFDPDEDGA
jgi:DNA-binding MarR family transcriptional regulator